MSSGFGLPFNQAPGSRQDERIGRAQDQASRARELPLRDAWVLSPLIVGVILSNRAALTADLIRFFYLGQFQKETHLRQARLNITGGSAGANVRTALYRYNQEDTGNRRLVKQADTEAKFLADSTGLQTVTLADGTYVTPGPLFLGIKASDNTLGVGGIAGAPVNRTMPIYTFQDNAGVLASIVEFPVLTKSYTGSLLDVLYISPDAAQVL